MANADFWPFGIIKAVVKVKIGIMTAWLQSGYRPFHSVESIYEWVIRHKYAPAIIAPATTAPLKATIAPR